VLNLEGLHGRYADPHAVYRCIADAAPEDAPTLLQELYSQPIDERYVRAAVRRAKDAGARLAVSVTPINAEWLLGAAIEEGADAVVVQSTVTSARHHSRSGWSLDLAGFCRQCPVPVIVGNTVAYDS